MTFRSFWGSVAVAFLAAPSACEALQAEERSAARQPESAKKGAEEQPRFIRVTRDDDDNPTALQTSTVRYIAPDEPREGLTVDLIGVVHIGERDYYRQLNQQFKQYDAVLYELVAPEGTRVPKKGTKKSSHPVGMLQTAMKDLLELSFQLDHVDYHQDNLVHADMSPDDFSKSMANRGESVWEIFLRMLAQGMVQQGKQGKGVSDGDLLLALFDRNRALALKRIMAQQFEDLGGAMAALDGPEGSTLITERNKKALEVLKKKIDSGAKRLAIFYGAGHMPDMSQRLESDFGLQREDEQWLTAWDLRSQSKQPVKKPVRKPGKAGKQGKAAEAKPSER
jgi:hypothetical protein